MTTLMIRLAWVQSLLLAAVLSAGVARSAESPDGAPLEIDHLKFGGEFGPEGGEFSMHGTFHTGGVPGEKRALYATETFSDVRIEERRMRESVRLKAAVVEGALERLVLKVEGGSRIRSVEGPALKEWSAGRTSDGTDFLLLRLTNAVRETVEFQIEAEQGFARLPAPVTPLRLTPEQALLRSGYILLRPAPNIETELIEQKGLVSMPAESLPSWAGDTSGGGLTFRHVGDYVLVLRASHADPEQRRIVLKDFALRGTLTEAGAELKLTALADVRPAEGGRLMILSGAVALTRANGQGYSMAVTNGQYAIEFPEAGQFPIEIEFRAKVEAREGWYVAEFEVAPSALRPITLTGVSEGTELQLPGASAPGRTGEEVISYLPSSGPVRLRWKEAQAEEEGKLFYAAEGLLQAGVAPGLLRQVNLLQFRVMQGQMDRLALELDGEGEIVRVDGDSILTWTIEKSGELGRQLVIQFNRSQTNQFQVQVQTQTALGAFPLRVRPMKVSPLGAIRYGGHMRIVNEGAVRLEVLNARALSQISPDQVPNIERLASWAPGSGAQVFAYRFSGTDFALDIQADTIQPEVGVSQLLTYHYGETEAVIEAEFELDIREAPLRELNLSIPAGFAAARVNAAQLSDYFLTPDREAGRGVLRLVFGEPLAGRQLISLRLERNQSDAGAVWTLPPLAVLDAKSVRGHIGVTADPGFRLAPTVATGVTEIATAYFPKRLAGIQAAFRLRDALWEVQMEVERLELSVQADVLHLFSIGEGIAYGSSVLNYMISGAPVAMLALELPAEYRNLDLAGRDIRNWRQTETGYEVYLHSPVSGAYTLLATYEQQFRAQGETLSLTGARAVNAQSEQGYVVAVSAYPFQLNPARISDNLIPLEPGELPSEYKLLFDAPVLAAYQYTTRPFSLDAELAQFRQGETVNQVVDRALVASRISRDGQVLTTAEYYLKSKGYSHFRLSVPKEAALWSAQIGGQKVVPVIDGDATLIPLPQTNDANAVLKLELSLASKAARPGRVPLTAPVLHAPVLLMEWNVTPDEHNRIEYRGGNLKPARGGADRSGFAQLSGLWERSAPARLQMLIGVAALLIGLALWGSVLRAGTFWIGARSVLAAAFGAIACLLSLISILLLMGGLDERQGAETGFQFVTPVQGSGTVLTVEFENHPSERGVLAFLAGAWPAVAGLVLWAAAGLRFTRGPRRAAWLIGWLLIFWGLLRVEGGAALFLLAAGLFVVAELIGPALVALWRMPRARLPRSDGDSGGTTAGATAAFLALLLAPDAWAAPSQPVDRKPPVPVAESLVQEGTVRGERVAIEAKLSWNAEKGQRLELLRGAAVLTSWRSSPEGLKLSQTLEGGVPVHWLIAEAPGRFEVDLHYEAPVGLREQLAGFTVPTHYALINRLRLVLEQRDVEVVSPAAVSILPLEEASVQQGTIATRVELVLPPVDGVWVGWKPRTRDLTREVPVYYAQWHQLYVPASGVVEGLHWAQVRLAQGRLTEIEFAIPEGLTITDVQAEGLTAWRFDPEQHALKAFLNPPGTGTFHLLVRSQVAVNPLPYTQTVGFVRMVGAAGETGLAGIGTGAEVQLDEAEALNLSPINLEDFSREVVNTLSQQIPGLTLRRAFRYLDSDATLAITAAAVEPDVRVQAQQTLSVGEDRVVLASELDVEISRAGVFKLSFALAPGFDVEAISGAALSHWTELQEEARTVTLHLQGRTEGRQRFAISLVGPGVGATNGWTVPKLVLAESSKHQGQLLVAPEQGMRLQIRSREGVTLLDPQKLGVQQKGVLAFRELNGDWQLSLDVEQVEAWIQLAALQEVTVREGQLNVAANLLFEIENTGVKSFEITLPAAAENVRFTGDQVADYAAPSEAVSGRKSWEVKLHRRVLGRYPLQVSYHILTPGRPEEALLTGIQAENVNVQRGYFAVRSSGRLQVDVASLPEGLQPAGWETLPADLRQGFGLSAPAHLFRVLQTPFEVPVRIIRHDAAQLLPARVASAELETVLSPSGATLTRVRLQIDPGSKRMLRVNLPDSARFWFAFFNHRSVRPWREGKDVLIPLEQSATPQQLAELEFLYVLPAGGKKGRDWALTGPQFDLPLEGIVWQVSMPADWELDDWSGTVQLRRKEASAAPLAVDLGAYLQEEQSRQRATLEQAEDYLQLGKRYLQSGEAQNAQRAFENATSLSEHDQAFNEDARVQLQNVKTQQAFLGLNRLQVAAAAKDEAGGKAAAVPQQQQFMQQVQQAAGQLAAEENSALSRLAERLVNQQQAAVAPSEAIRPALPREGKVLTFSRSLQVDPRAPLTLNLEIRQQTGPGAGRFWSFLLLAVGVLVMAWTARRMRQPGGGSSDQRAVIRGQ